MKALKSLGELEEVYGLAKSQFLKKPHEHITPSFCKWIESSHLAILSTVAGEGTDASLRGDDGPVVQVVDDKTILLPDWRGNNRLDSLRNIVRDPRASLLFLIGGEEIVIGVNGTAKITADAEICDRFEKRGKRPKTVLVLRVDEVYIQCPKAIMRSDFWNYQPKDLPDVGTLMHEQEPDIDAEEFEKKFKSFASEILWE